MRLRHQCHACGSWLAVLPHATLMRCPVCMTVNALVACRNVDANLVCADTPTQADLLRQMNTEQVVAYLRQCNVDQSILHQLQVNVVDGPQLLKISSSDLEQFGLKKGDLIDRFLVLINQLRSRSA
jgi:LSD1 subclass zinc finger protein